MDPGEYSKRGLSEFLSDLLWRVGIATDRCATAVSFSSSRSSGILIAFSIAGVGSYIGPSAMSLQDLNRPRPPGMAPPRLGPSLNASPNASPNAS